MDRKSKDEDQKARAEEYGKGLVAVIAAVKGFRELTGIDLTANVDISGKHMGERPTVKLTAERLAEVTAKIEADVADLAGVSDDIAAIAESITRDAVVVDIRRGFVTVDSDPA